MSHVKKVSSSTAHELETGRENFNDPRKILKTPEDIKLSFGGHTIRAFHIARRCAYRFISPLPRKPVVTLWNNFMPPPYGGSNQFFLALERALQRQGVETLRNNWSRSATAHIFNSLAFHFYAIEDLRKYHSESVFIHRIDGPISVYRNDTPKKSDDIVFYINQFMDASVFQSQYSYSGCLKLGYQPASPCIVRNSVDSEIFNMKNKTPFSKNRKIRLISTSWSSNERKGRDTYAWLDNNLDFDRIDFLFIGNCDVEFQNIKRLPPKPSGIIAEHLRNADIFIFPSMLESAPNAVSEAMACGLPVIYHDSGGTAEIVQKGGVGYSDQKNIPNIIEQIKDNYELYQNSISIPSIDGIAKEYMSVIKNAMQSV